MYPIKIGFFHYWHHDQRGNDLASFAGPKTFFAVPVDDSTVEFVLKNEKNEISYERVKFNKKSWQNIKGGELSVSLETYAEKTIVSKGFQPLVNW